MIYAIYNHLKISSANHIQVASYVLLFCYILSLFLPIPGPFKAGLALSWLAIVPFGIGIGFLGLVSKIGPLRTFSKYPSDIGSSGVLVQWIIGLGLIMMITYIVFYTPVRFADISLLFLIGSVLGSILPVERNYDPIRITTTKLRIIIVAALIIGILFSAYIRSYSPYPLTPGSDIFTHLYVIKSIQDKAIEESPLLYIPTFDILVALAASSFSADLVELFWLGIFLLACSFSVGLCLLSYRITRNWALAILSVVIGLLMTEQGLVPNLQVFYPSSFAMSLFPLTLYLLSRTWEKPDFARGRFVITAFVLTGIMMIHVQVGIVASMISAFYLGLTYLARERKHSLFPIRLSTIAIVIVLLLYYYGALSKQIELNIGSGEYSYPIATKTRHLGEWYTDQIVILSMIGMLVSALSREQRVVIIGFIASIILLVYFQKIDSIHRIMTLERPLLSIMATVCLALPLSLINGLYKREGLQIFLPSTWIKVIGNNSLSLVSIPIHLTRRVFLYVFTVFVLIFPTLLEPYDMYISAYSERNFPFVNFTIEEWEAAKWIENNTPEDYKVLSDPFTVIEMRGLAHRKNIEGIAWNHTVGELVNSSLLASSPRESYEIIAENLGTRNIIVVTPRTSEWVRGSDYFISFPVNRFESFPGFGNFLNQDYYKMIYKSENIFVFLQKTSD